EGALRKPVHDRLHGRAAATREPSAGGTARGGGPAGPRGHPRLLAARAAAGGRRLPPAARPRFGRDLAPFVRSLSLVAPSPHGVPATVLFVFGRVGVGLILQPVAEPVEAAAIG